MRVAGIVLVAGLVAACTLPEETSTLEERMRVIDRENELRQLARLESELRTQRRRAAWLGQKIEETKVAVSQLRDRRRTEEEKLPGLRKNLSTAQAASKGVQDQITAEKAKTNELQAELDRERGEQEKNKAKIEAVRGEIAALEKELEIQRAALAERHAALLRLEAQRAELAEEVDAARGGPEPAPPRPDDPSEPDT